MTIIHLPSDIESWYLKEIGKFFKKNRILSYKDSAGIIKNRLGISFKTLLTAKPKDLENYAQIIKTLTSLPNIDRQNFIKLYANFRSRVISKKLLQKINLKVCPYCNRNYIFNFGNKKQQATAQLDHFYDKSTYPYLSLCLYNLIPSCPTCNLRKSKKDVLAEPIFNPYIENLNDYITFKSTAILSLKETTSKHIGFFSEERICLEFTNDSRNPRVDEHLNTFNIQALYDSHRDVVAELHQKRIMYSDEYLDWIENELGSTLFNDRSEMMRLITCGYMDDKDIHKRPLSKLIKDISEELGLI